MSDKPIGCARPTGGPVGTKPVKEKTNEQNFELKKEKIMVEVKVGQKAPDFESSAFYKGEFKNIKLSDYLGKWVVLCFYPGDFTFV